MRYRGFRRNPFFEPQVRAGIDLRRALAAHAEEAAREAGRIAAAAGAPWMPRHRGDVVTVDESGTEVRVVNTDHGAHLQEFGSRNNPPHAPLRRGARAAGMRLTDTP